MYLRCQSYQGQHHALLEPCGTAWGDGRCVRGFATSGHAISEALWKRPRITMTCCWTETRRSPFWLSLEAAAAARKLCSLVRAPGWSLVPKAPPAYTASSARGTANKHLQSATESTSKNKNFCVAFLAICLLPPPQGCVLPGLLNR